MLIMVTSYFPRIIHEIVRDAREIIPKPDSIPLRPASILVRLDPMESAIGIEIKYRIPTFEGAAQIKGRPAKNSKNNFSLDDKTSKSSTIPIIPTSNITTKTIHLHLLTF